jgi:hypothetical protein
VFPAVVAGALLAGADGVVGGVSECDETVVSSPSVVVPEVEVEPTSAETGS